MRIFLQIILITIALNCTGQIFNLETEFQPSFLPGSNLILQDDGKQCFLDLKGETFSEHCIITDLQLVDIKSFLNHYQFKIKVNNDTLGTITKIENGDTITSYLRSMGTDGIGVNGKLIRDNLTKKFKFWSPNKGTANDSLIVLLFKLMNRNLKEAKTVNYLEQLKQYFRFELGLKKLSDSPLTYKLYGSITAHEEDELNTFFKSLPLDSVLYFDMSNFDSMGTMFYPTFRALCERNKNIYWLNCSAGALKQLNEIGISPSRIR
ncbi:MAG TPA: hypothetical protein DCL77_03760 [Prolixibacteraceae bacterium]|jgi:hypothetical protein|nr:hypothetical protein [Prolixibacteraceae bacterium]